MAIAYLIGRLLVPIIFIVAGIQKFMNVAGVAKTLQASRLPIPAEIDAYVGSMSRYEAVGYGVAAIEVLGGLMILAGLKARWGAVALVLLTIGTIAFVHDFWTMEGAAAAMNQTQALKNLSILGGLLLIVAGGSRGAMPEGRR